MTLADMLAGKKLILVVNDPLFFLSHRGNIAKAAGAAGMQVIVATPPDPGCQRISAEGYGKFEPIPLHRWSANPAIELRTIAALAALYRRERPNIVHHVTIKPMIYGSIAARLTGVPAVINAVSGLGQVFSATGSPLHRLRRRAVHALYRIAFSGRHTAVICQNRHDAAELTRCGLTDSRRITLIKGAGVDPAPYADNSEGPVPTVLFASRLLREKGVLEFAAAARALRAEGINARFQLAGEPIRGNPGSLSESEFEELKTEGVIECLGHIADLAPLLSRSAIVCLPTYYREGIPRILIEAAAAGKPIVATLWPGVDQVVDDQVSGVLVPPRDVGALTAALRRLLADRPLRERFGAAAREKFAREGFSEEAVVGATLNLYRKVLEAANEDLGG